MTDTHGRKSEPAHDEPASELSGGDLLRIGDDHGRGLHTAIDPACIRCRIEPLISVDAAAEAEDPQ